MHHSPIARTLKLALLVALCSPQGCARTKQVPEAKAVPAAAPEVQATGDIRALSWWAALGDEMVARVGSHMEILTCRPGSQLRRRLIPGSQGVVAPIIMGRGPGFIVKHDSDLVAMAVERDGSTIVVGAAPRAAPVDQVTFDSFGFLFSRGALVGRTVQGVVTWAELPSGKPLMIARLDADGVALVAEPTKVVVHDFGRGANQTLWELPPGATCGTPRVLDAESPPDLLAARKGCALLVCGYSSFLEICGREVQEWSIGIGPFDQYSFDADFTALWSASRSGLNIARDAFSPPPPPLPVNARPESVRPIGRVHCGEGELRDFGGMRGLVVGEDFILETLHEAGHG